AAHPESRHRARHGRRDRGQHEHALRGRYRIDHRRGDAPMRWLALVVLLVGNHIPTPFPDGSDSIGIPDEPYAATCFIRVDAVPGQVVQCAAAQRVVPDPTRTSIVLPIDCATHARHTTAELPLPLPTGDWRIAGTGWCLMVQRTD